MKQFLTNKKGERTAVVLPLNEYERLVAAAEELEDSLSMTRRRPGRDAEKLSQRRIAERIEISKTTVNEILKRFRSETSQTAVDSEC